jgi:hypothetical protein
MYVLGGKGGKERNEHQVAVITVGYKYPYSNRVYKIFNFSVMGKLRKQFILSNWLKFTKAEKRKRNTLPAFK